MRKDKLIAIVGPTGAGKTALGVFLAKKFNGEIVSADSRQIYKELSVGTAKPAGRWQISHGKLRYISEGVVHHLVDELDPKEEFTLADFKKRALEATTDMIARGKLPVLVGGTGQYVYALLENWDIPNIPPNQAFRARMRAHSAKELDSTLRRIDPEAADIAEMNPRRLIRALEIHEETGKRPTELQTRGPALFEVLKIGIPLPDNYELLVRARVELMLQNNLIGEIRELIKRYSWDLPAMQSIDYQEFRDYLNEAKSLDYAKERAVQAHKHFAKRQMTWFKRDKDIKWVKSKKEAESLVEKFII